MGATQSKAISTDYVDGEDTVLDMMADNVDILAQLVTEQLGNGREFKGMDDQPIEGKKSDGRLEYEKFMMNPIVVEMHETNDKNAPTLVFVGVNGRQRWLPRGAKVRIPRFLVERLAQSREMFYSTKQNHDPSRDNAMDTHRKQAAPYGFTVVHDPHPKGRAWLERMVRSGS